MLRDAGVRVGGYPEGVVALLQRLTKEPVGRVWLPGSEKGFRRAGERAKREGEQPHKTRAVRIIFPRPEKGNRSRLMADRIMYITATKPTMKSGNIYAPPPPLTRAHDSTREGGGRTKKKRTKRPSVSFSRPDTVCSLSPSKLLHGHSRFPGERQRPSSTDRRLNRQAVHLAEDRFPQLVRLFQHVRGELVLSQNRQAKKPEVKKQRRHYEVPGRRRA